MKKLILLFTTIFIAYHAFPCTNLIVTKGASADGSTFLFYSNDGEWIYHIDKTPAKDHQQGDSLEFSGRFGAKGKIHQIPHTYAVVGFQMNEHQVAVGETTFLGRKELWNKSKYLEYWHLMRLALERAKTAREAIQVMTSLAEQYGYGSEGESFSIADPNEAWILEMIGTGDGGEGAVWVAVKIPDGYISAHANMARIGEFPLNDPENCLYSDNVISFAVEKGYYNPDSGKEFRFNEVYCPPNPESLKYCETRVWSLFNRAAPSKELSTDYCRAVKGAERYPLYIKPDKKITLENMFDLVRDHYEGTEFDMTKGVDAGPFGSPNRWRPLSWEKDSVKYSWERPVSTVNSAFSYIAQLRSNLPNEVGGIAWYGVDDTYFSCYFPVYCGVTEISEPFTKGDIRDFSWESAWWTFNFVSNFSNLKYSYMKKDIQKVQHNLESKFISAQDSIVKTALSLSKAERIDFLTEYSCNQGILVHKEWVDLAEFLIMKYNDGYMKNKDGKITSPGYSNDWKQNMINIYPDKFKIPQ